MLRAGKVSVVVEFVFAGGVEVVANFAPASHLHIVEVVFADAGRRCIVNSIIFPGEDGFVGSPHQAGGVAIGVRGIGPVSVAYRGGVKPARAVVVDGVAVGGEKTLVDKDKPVRWIFYISEHFNAEVLWNRSAGYRTAAELIFAIH
jgi:hypothetical protein